MNNQSSSPDSPEIPPHDSEDAESYDSQFAEGHRRRQRLDPRDPRSHRQGGNSRRHRRNTELNQRIAKRVMIGACCVLAVVGVFMVGFLFGQKTAQADATSHKAIAPDITMPSPDSQSLLDKAFGEMGAGKYRQAMMGFQKVQDNQAALSGIDYLIAESAYKAGETQLAEDAANSAISKNETADDARVLLAVINLNKSTNSQAPDDQFTDPKVAAENEMKNFVALHPENAKGYLLLGDLERSNGKTATAIDYLHSGALRAAPENAKELLSAKEQLARLQNDPAKTAPSLSAMTALSAEQCLTAALACLQLHKSEDAVVFLGHARELYTPQIFRELMNDPAFSDYHTDPEMIKFLRGDTTSAPL